MKSFMNTPDGLRVAIEWDQTVHLFFGSMDHVDSVTRCLILEVLVGMCGVVDVIADGHM